MSESADSLVSLAKKSVLEGVLVADAKVRFLFSSWNFLCIMHFALQGIIRSVNDHVCRIFGYTKHQLLGHDIKMLMEPAYRVSRVVIQFCSLRLTIPYALGPARPLHGKLFEDWQRKSCWQDAYCIG